MDEESRERVRSCVFAAFVGILLLLNWLGIFRTVLSGALEKRLRVQARVGHCIRGPAKQPFTPRVSNTNSSLGEANRPDRISEGNAVTPPVERWVDLSAFPVVPTGAFSFGNSGRNILDGPGYLALNVSMFRNFAIKEKTNLQFRWETFIILNHINLHIPVDMANAANAGTIRVADAWCPMQLGARLQF